MPPLLTVGTLASRAGVSADTIRYYEKLGLLPRAARTPAGYRQYPEGALARIAVIRNAQRFGFTLKELASFLRIRDRGGRPCDDVRAAAQRLLDAVDRQIVTLTTARDRMRETLADWDARLAHTPPHAPARLLESLAVSTNVRPDASFTRARLRSRVSRRS
jgi:DNA-binding transcriptional MerR regulator